MKIPSGWQQIYLSRLARIQTGIAKGNGLPKDPVELPYLRVANVRDGSLDLAEVKTIKVDRSRIDRYKLQNGDVVLTEGGDLDKLGRGTVWNGEIPICLHQNHVFAVRVDRSKLLPSFFALQAASPYGKRYFLSCAKRTTNLASINKTQLGKFPVLLPPLWEQRKIARILETWDEAIVTTEQLIAALERRQKGLMQRLLTGRVRFPEFVRSNQIVETRIGKFPADWQVVRFTDLFKIEIGRTPSRRVPQYWDSDKVTDNVWLSIADLTQKYVSESKEHISDTAIEECNMRQLPISTLVMSFKLTIGRAAILQVPAFTNEAICSLIPKNSNCIHIPYLYHALNTINFEQEIDQAVKGKTLNKAKLNRVQIALPSLPEQVKLAEFFDHCDKQISWHKQEVEAIRAQKKGLMQRLLTGRVRVRPDDEDIEVA